MNRKKIRLQVLNIANSQAQVGAYAMLLGEADGPRRLPIIIGAAEAQAILIEMKGIFPPRPLTHNLFASVLEVLGVELLRIVIYKAENGVFYSYLYMKAETNIIRVDARTSDAVVLALRMQAPIMIYEDILDAEKIKEDGNYSTENELPHNSIEETNLLQEGSIEMLQKAMQKAVDKEDYERAALLRDEINKRIKQK